MHIHGKITLFPLLNSTVSEEEANEIDADLRAAC